MMTKTRLKNKLEPILFLYDYNGYKTTWEVILILCSSNEYSCVAIDGPYAGTESIFNKRLVDFGRMRYEDSLI